ncbi:MAG TPA: penicillin-binding transpeptidase domain-containing protein [Gammaproteobacteria bacterium]|nr:penicillin-binding transpeptidase domain-containing protein [Gammaproteobacteria bacterium]
MQFFLGVAIFALVARLSFLQIFNKDFLNAQGNARILRTVTIPSYRGLVTDRRGSPIAVSTPVDSIWVNPKHFHATQSQLTQLSSLLALPPHDIVTKIKQYSHRSFLYLKRALTPEHAAKIEKLNIPGIYTQREFRRYYPAGPVTAQLLGFTNIDDEGQAGIELAFDQWLKPIPGKKRVLEDRMGHWIQDVDHSLVPRQGGNLALSIDLRIQTLAYNALNEALKRLNAKSATLVMLDIVSGEVLAMVSVPSFNPNVYHERTSKGVRNKALTDQIEPGSTAKALSMVSLLEHSPFSIDDEVDTNPGFYRLGGHLIRDVRNFGKLTLSQVLVKSSNIGLSKFIIQRPSEELLNTFKSFGLGTDITNFFPGENSGRLPSPTKSPIVTATWSFGYGFTATPLQLVHAYATLASRGKKQPISLLKLEDTIPKGDQIISSETAEHVIRMLTEVLNTSGTGRRASIKGYKTAGKTGTTRLVGSSGYDADRHNALFIGFTPVDEPRLATLVLIEEPDESNDHYYGGFAAAPVYAQVVRSALHMLNVPPDNA